MAPTARSKALPLRMAESSARWDTANELVQTSIAMFRAKRIRKSSRAVLLISGNFRQHPPETSRYTKAAAFLASAAVSCCLKQTADNISAARRSLLKDRGLILYSSVYGKSVMPPIKNFISTLKSASSPVTPFPLQSVAANCASLICTRPARYFPK